MEGQNGDVVMAKADDILTKIFEYFYRHDIPLQVQRINKGYSIIHESGDRVARIKPDPGSPDQFEVLWWSHRDKWDHIGDFGGVVMSLDEALDYVASDPIGIFWR